MAETGSGDKLKVFISYSRRDSSDFADELVTGLELVGFAPFLDRHDVAPGEPWEERLGGLIQQADTVVYVISPEAVKSERCEWEVDKTLALSKRLIPIVFKSVPEADIPEQLRRRQFVRFDAGAGFARPLAQLAEALRQDLDWIREHTRMGELAAHWEARGRPQSLLLRGDDIAAAQAWIERRKSDAPAIADVIRAFIGASKEAEAKSIAKTTALQRRIIRTQALLTVALVATIIGLIGWINQAYIAAQWHWYTIQRPFVKAKFWPYVLGADAERALKAKDIFWECAPDQAKNYCPPMVVVPAGAFVMGSPPSESNRVVERPQHTVTIAKPLAVSKYELKFDEWDACVAWGDCDPRISDSGWGRGQRPVINVNWNDAKQYVAWLARVTGKPYRLLTDAEYEYATRAGTSTAYPWGDDIGENKANCNGCGSRASEGETATVGKFPPNQFGLHDMVGNVMEWTEDCLHYDYNGAPTDGTAWIKGACDQRIVRGRSWSGAPDGLRSAYRSSLSADVRYDRLGFRVARTLDTP